MPRPSNPRKVPARHERLYALDSLRGIAAVVVMLRHLLIAVPETVQAQLPLWVTLNPLRIFLNSYFAVTLFFVLSGYVLAPPFFAKARPLYFPFIIKRLCRIYLPFVFAIL